MVRIGEKVEDFKVDVFQNEAFKELKLSELFLGQADLIGRILG